MDELEIMERRWFGELAIHIIIRRGDPGTQKRVNVALLIAGDGGYVRLEDSEDYHQRLMNSLDA